MKERRAIWALNLLLAPMRRVTAPLELGKLSLTTELNEAENGWLFTWNGPALVCDWSIITFENAIVGDV